MMNFSLLMISIIIVLVLLQMGLQIFATIDLVKSHPYREQTEFVLWILVIWLISTIGAILYFIIGRVKHESITETRKPNDWS
ncbi:MAG: PLD nuclease N-terminal domain-containing protein [Candidatus Heimdallarchaeum endolithica]|uniref:PLD nuclease N-terminal domain-containing protein n=1 Tax=Candidatus Heimdallarchaeum endolithica TaxID=2876572 RepID=A0A9Y1BSV8_9ARCH|nr:MAG: PLD nuclease N-terminal domain-containing protein [Candidatus Heimdallarchaeum endolithica]